MHISMKKFNLISLFLLINVLAQAQKMKTTTAGTIVDQIKATVTCDWSAKTVDTFKSGNEKSEITGIATTFLANLDVLKRAKAQGLNMVITHEPTFYNHFDEKEQYGDDPILKAKLKFIEENDMVIWRFHDHWHRTRPDGIYKGIVAQLKWTAYEKEPGLYSIPEMSLKELAQYLKTTFNAKAIRVIGDPDLKLTQVALRLGAPGSMAQIEMLKREDVEVLIGGEGQEWETVEYVRDAISAGMNKAMIFLGHAISEEAGMEYCAEWLKTFISEVPVEFIPAREPFWIPE